MLQGPEDVAKKYREDVRRAVDELPEALTLCGFLTDSAPKPSRTYARYTRAGCEDVGIRFELRECPRLEFEEAIRQANADPRIHGILIYYPVFGTGQDDYLKDLIDHRKDVEGLGRHWIQRLYENIRVVEGEPKRKALLPCTPLAVLKMLVAAGSTNRDGLLFGGRTVTIFNRSEVVGRPLAAMMSNDGARVYSFDVDGPILFERGKISETGVTREEALRTSDIVITGVPVKTFEKVRAEEVREDAVCVNFATVRNFEASVKERVRVYVPRVGPVTVAMCLRNTLRLYRNFHESG